MNGKPERIPVRVGEIVAVTSRVKRFRLDAVDGSLLPPFSGGAHITLEMRDGDMTRRNAYSLMSPPRDTSHYTISVRRDAEGRGGSCYLHDRLAVGDTLQIGYPVNLFPVDHRAKRHLLIAGGIGITPFIAMMDQLLHENRVFELHYANRTRRDGAYMDDLAARYGQRVHFYHSERGERIPLERLLGLQPVGTHCYVCGPERMIDWAKDVAATLGWPSGHLHYERFLAPPTGAPYAIRLAASNLTVQVGADQSMLEAIEAAGVEAPYMCRGGVCGACETHVLECEGTLQHVDHYLSDEDKASGTKVMPCVSRFEGRTLVLDR